MSLNILSHHPIYHQISNFPMFPWKKLTGSESAVNTIQILDGLTLSKSSAALGANKLHLNIFEGP